MSEESLKVVDGKVETDVGWVHYSQLDKWKLVLHYMAPIMEYYKDPSITEIMVNSYDSIFVEGKNGIEKVDVTFGTESNLTQFITNLSLCLGQDREKMGILHARFPDQSRACCTDTSITPTGATMTLRRAPKETLSFDQLIEFGSMSNEMREYIGECVRKGNNIVISGSTASGKTTLIRAISEFLPTHARIIVCEDTQELHLKIPNIIMMEAPKRRDNTYQLSDLIETTLRQRPDRVFVGEIRDAAACDAFLQVINTGHSGCCTSIHANGPKEAISRIQYLLAKEGLLSYELAETEVKHSVQLFIHADRTSNGKRVTNISRINEKYELEQVFGYDESIDKHYGF